MNAPTVAVRDIHKSFGPLQVLKGVSLEAGDGEVISIIGASGSGKSTLLRCIPLLEIPNAGEISIAGETLKLRPGVRGAAMRPADQGQLTRLRAQLGFVFQSFNLWPHMTVLENVIEVPVHVQKRPRAEAVDEAMSALEKVGIAAKRDSYPAHLSGGQQQRAAIARALAVRPKAILFDEPTSALDPELVGEVLRVIKALAEEGRTMLIVTHEMGFAAEVSTRAVFLHAGQIEEQGPPRQVFSDPISERCRQFVTRHLHR
jgi:octopine/nopaline transport system ATP-binding protein